LFEIDPSRARALVRATNCPSSAGPKVIEALSLALQSLTDLCCAQSSTW